MAAEPSLRALLLVLCAFQALLHAKPSEPHLVPYLVQVKHFSEDQVVVRRAQHARVRPLTPASELYLPRLHLRHAPLHPPHLLHGRVRRR